RSPIRAIADADRSGVRIAVVRNHASTLALSRTAKNAELVSAEIPDATFDLLRTGAADAFASVRPNLMTYLSKLPGSRVLDDRYGSNVLSMVVPKNHAGWLSYVSEFAEEVKVSGLVQRAIDQAGWRGVQVALVARMDVRFRRQSGHHANLQECPLMTQSGHRGLMDTLRPRPVNLALISTLGRGNFHGRGAGRTAAGCHPCGRCCGLQPSHGQR